jgi:hypothetical protein
VVGIKKKALKDVNTRGAKSSAPVPGTEFLQCLLCRIITQAKAVQKLP